MTPLREESRECDNELGVMRQETVLFQDLLHI
jgi:hypothetical protein